MNLEDLGERNPIGIGNVAARVGPARFLVFAQGEHSSNAE